jgi:arylsulfatase
MIAPESYKKRFLDQGFAESTAARYGMIENIDDNFGRMMAKLEEWGALDNTLIIFMTDNGMNGRWLEYQDGSRQPAFNAGMRGHKGSSWEGGTNVPAFWSWQGVLPAGSDISALTAHIDLYRTLAELAGAELPEGAFKPNGRSMLPLLEDAQADWPDRKLFFHRGRWGFEHVSSGMTRADSRYDRAAVRTRQWRLVFDLEEGEQVIHLADIQADPGETTNLATQYPEVVEELTQAFDQWWVSTEPYLVNEGLPLIPESEHPFNLRYEAQLKTQGIPLWEPGG